MKIYIDIETRVGNGKPDPSSIKAPGNYKDPDKIAAYQAAAVDDEWRKQALQPLNGRLACIGFAIEEEPARCVIGLEEKQVLAEFVNVLRTVHDNLPAGAQTITWIGHNIAEFDLLWLRLRALKYGMFWLAKNINLDRYRGNFQDTMLMSGTWSNKFRLDDLCRFFGLDGKPDGMDGSKVHDLWQAGKYADIVEYCKQDVEQVRALHEILISGDYWS